MHSHGDLPAPVRETIDLWVSDFFDRPAAAAPAGRVGEAAATVLSTFLEVACDARGPSELSEGAISHALLDHVAGLSLPPTAMAAVPDLVAAFLADLEDVGRLADGRTLAAHVRAIAGPFRDRAAGRPATITRPAAKVGRNDPCPCGSGRKYKQCCLRALG